MNVGPTDPAEEAVAERLAGPGSERPAGRATSTLLTVAGPRGSGRSHLLHALRARWREQGALVLSAAPDPDPDVALAAFHQLLAGGVGRTSGLPQVDATALAAAFGWTDDPADALDPSRLAAAARVALVALAAGRRVLLVLDDADRFDDASRLVLDALLQQLPPGVAALRSVTTPFGHTHPPSEGHVVRLGPWPARRAGALLDAQPQPPTGRLRRRILAQAAGNPAALVGLARVFTAHPELDTSPLALPPPPSLVEAFAAGLTRLPEATVLALAAAAAVRGDLASMSRALPGGVPDAVWEPAVAAGLVHRRGRRWHFAHPMIRAAALHAVPPGRRRELHRRLAATAGEPGRRAWHRALAADGPDEVAAVRLERVADQLARGGAVTAAAEVLVAAAQVSPEGRDRRRRTALAARAARVAHDPEWATVLSAAAGPGADELLVTDGASARPAGPEGPGSEKTGSAEVRDVAPVDVAAAVEALAGATHDLYVRGRIRDREVLTDLVARTAVDTRRTARLLRVWAGALIEPGAQREAAAAFVQEADPGRPLRDDAAGVDAFTAAPGETARWVGTAALLLDETSDALRHLAAATPASGPDDVHPAAAEAMAFALLDAGRPTEARDLANALLGRRSAVVPPAVRAGAAVVVAVADLWTSAPGREDSLRAAVTAFDPHDLLHLAVRLRRAQGVAAASAGDHETAWRHLRWLWARNTVAIHTVLSDVAIGDLAAAAVHGGRAAEARGLLAGAERRATRDASLRRRLALHRARALLGPEDRAEHHFRLALVHPGGEQWPLERALARLDYAEWLRRRQRPSDARPQLSAALDTFAARDAAAWTARAEAELAATGATRTSTDPGTPTHLTLQQRTIAELAAQGLSNRQIADQLFLSVRTVTTHLSHVFTALGVSRRMHLAAALRGAEGASTGGRGSTA